MSKAIFITGAGSGLGRGAAIGLAKKGHRLIATTETTSQKTSLLREAEELGLEMEIFKLDIQNPRDRAQIDNYDFDIFVANAAINEGGPLAEVPMDRIRELFDVNVFSTLETVQHAARKFVEKGKGKIIFMSSMAGITATPYVGPYTATKHAIEALAKTLQLELKKHGIQVATINPGAYNTGFNDRSSEEIYKWYDEKKNFTRLQDMKEQEKMLDQQYEPQDMIDKMIEIIPSDHHKFRTVWPKEMIDKLINTEKERWDMEI